jgi:putative ATPase
MPEGLEDQHWYQPTDRGLEIKIAEKMQRLAALNRQAEVDGKARKR